jgi:SPP1 gp7 family putative phage head morphogenesis protein
MAGKRVPKKWVDAPYAQARRFLLSKKVVSSAKFARLEIEAKVRAFTVTGVNKLDTLQRILDSLDDAARKGTPLKKWIEGFDRLMEQSGVDPLDAWRAETIFRTNIQSAYSSGRWESGRDSDDTWGWRYFAVEDDRVREEHLALSGNVFEGEDGAGFWPPWDFGCRCTSEWITLREARDLGLEGTDEIPMSAQEEFLKGEFASPALGREYRPDLSGFDPQLVSDFQQDAMKRVW